MGSDILALQARECAKAGGSTYLASSWSIHNDLARQQPEVLETLFSKSWPIQVYVLPCTNHQSGKGKLTKLVPGTPSISSPLSCRCETTIW